MNNYLVNIAKQTVKKDPVSPEDIEKLITQMSTISDGFKMQEVQYYGLQNNLNLTRIIKDCRKIDTKTVAQPYRRITIA